MDNCKLHEENINLKLTSIHARLEAIQDMNAMSVEHHNEKLEKILEQTTRTNGRVGQLEKQTTFWRWLSTRPYRLIISIIVIIMAANFVTNDQIVNLIIRVFR